MTNTDVDIPEVISLVQRGRFYKDDAGRDMIEISFVGQKDTVVHYVTPAHMAQYKHEWDAYCDKQPLELRKGTPLSLLFDEKNESKYVAANVHNLEELAELNDVQCQGLGRGTMTDRETARNKLVQLQGEADAARRKKIDQIDTMPLSTAQPSVSDQEFAELKQTIGEMQEGMKTLQEAMLMLIKREPQGEKPKRKGWPKGKKRRIEPIEPDPPAEEPEA